MSLHKLVLLVEKEHDFVLLNKFKVSWIAYVIPVTVTANEFENISELKSFKGHKWNNNHYWKAINVPLNAEIFKKYRILIAVKIKK